MFELKCNKCGMSQKVDENEIWESDRIQFNSKEHFGHVDLIINCMSCDNKGEVEIEVDAVCTY